MTNVKAKLTVNRRANIAKPVPDPIVETGIYIIDISGTNFSISTDSTNEIFATNISTTTSTTPPAINLWYYDNISRILSSFSYKKSILYSETDQSFINSTYKTGTSIDIKQSSITFNDNEDNVYFIDTSGQPILNEKTTLVKNPDLLTKWSPLLVDEFKPIQPIGTFEKDKMYMFTNKDGTKAIWFDAYDSGTLDAYDIMPGRDYYWYYSSDNKIYTNVLDDNKQSIIVYWKDINIDRPDINSDWERIWIFVTNNPDEAGTWSIPKFDITSPEWIYMPPTFTEDCTFIKNSLTKLSIVISPDDNTTILASIFPTVGIPEMDNPIHIIPFVSPSPLPLPFGTYYLQTNDRKLCLSPEGAFGECNMNNSWIYGDDNIIKSTQGNVALSTGLNANCVGDSSLKVVPYDPATNKKFVLESGLINMDCGICYTPDISSSIITPNGTQTKVDQECKPNDWNFIHIKSDSKDKKWLRIILLILLIVALIGGYIYYRHKL